MEKKLVIIPTYNEKENIEDIILEVFSLEENFDILVVDDSSPDGTADIVRSMNSYSSGRLFLELRKKKEGLGPAYIAGFKWALRHGYEFIFEMDADFSHNPKDLKRIYNSCKSNDMVVGSRYNQGVNVVNWPMSRLLLSFFASKYVKIITGMPICDATAGFVCYRRRVLEGIDLDKIKFVGYSFQIEMKYRAYCRGFKIKEIPIVFKDRQRGTSKMNVNIIGEAVFGVIKLRFMKLFNKI